MDKKQEKLIKKWIKLIQKKGDRAAADELVTYYYKEIYGYTYKQTSNKELAMDLTQEIFVNMLQSIQSYDEKKSAELKLFDALFRIY
jgi:RNA polymerase sigma-70 factor (ECF subfamily)